MIDHDQRFKTLLHQFLGEFVELFFPEWAARLDLSRPEWLEQEQRLDPPRGEKAVADLVARVSAREAVPEVARGAGESWLILIHVEIESDDSSEPIRPRMFGFYHNLRLNHGLPVLPIVLFLRVGRDGLGWDVYEESLWGRTLLRFEYPYVGLPALDGPVHVAGENLLGVALAALMRVPRDAQARLKFEAVRRIATSSRNEVEKELLLDCVETYFPLQGGQAVEYERLEQSQSQPEVRAMTSIWREQGILQGRRELLRRQLEKKFGPLGEGPLRRLLALSAEQLEQVGLALLDAGSLKDLGLEDGPVDAEPAP